MQAQAEYFDFAQGRSINEFVMHKLRLLNAVSGVKYDEKNLIAQIHQSIHHDEYRAAADYARFQGLAKYRRTLSRLENDQKAIWERNRSLTKRLRDVKPGGGHRSGNGYRRGRSP
ncbi:hypothetical protein TWF481_002798 [Arthrobotrys musiformis]|uniref:Uncharacterized protein n=1 Tax=Arthrobotrys musiformis TaxID=47236 RepID=A0AAV9VR99_9PEZI